MNEKIFMKKKSGYFWILLALIWSLFILVIIYTSRDYIAYIMIALSLVNIVIDVLNAYFILSGSYYILITNVGVERKQTLMKPKKIIYFENIKSVQIKKRMLGKAICINTMSKPYYIYDGYQKPLEDIKKSICDRIN